MMCYISLLMIIIMIKMSINNKNPVKLSILLMLSVSMMSSMLWYTASYTWFPLIFYMLFLGGILIMFLILSTTMPNEKMEKIKMSFMFIFGYFLFILNELMKITSSSAMKMSEIKWFLVSSYNLSFMVLIVIGYFILFTLIISMEKMSLRSIM